MIVILIRNIAHLHIKIISVGIVGERGCFPFLFFTRERDLVTVFDAIWTSRQTREKLQCLYENPMSNNFCKTAVLEKI